MLYKCIIEMKYLYKHKYYVMHLNKKIKINNKIKLQAVEDLKKGIDPIEFAKSSNQIIVFEGCSVR